MQAIIGKQFPEKVIPLIEAAKDNIKIVVFDWRWYPNDPGNPVQLFNQSIVRAVRRGVKVEVVANCDAVVKTLQSVGVVAKKIISKNLVHAKLMIFDGRIVVVGSHNFTQSAFTMNHEISAVYDDPISASGFINFFDKLCQL